MTCGTCKHWKPGPTRSVLHGNTPVEFPGTCHRYPPDTSDRRPRTDRTESCGEWASATLTQRLADALVIERDAKQPGAPSAELFTLDASQGRPACDEAGATANNTAAGAPAAPEGEAKAGPPSGRKSRPGSRR